MQSFNEKEKYIIKSLIEYAKNTSLSLEGFLKKYYFKENLNRGLVIQNQRQYAVFFLKTELFANESLKTNEINSFFELLSLLKSLIQKGIIHIFTEKTENIYFIQDDFESAKILNNGSIILNSKGYFSSAPDTILDTHKNEVYKGMQFSGEQFQLIFNHCIGNLIISEEINTLISEEASSTNNNEVQSHAEKKTVLNLNNSANQTNEPIAEKEKNTPINTKDSPHKAIESKIKESKKNTLLIGNFLVTICLLLFFVFEFFYSNKKINELSEKIKNVITTTNAVMDSMCPISSNLKNIKKSVEMPSNQLSESYGVYYGIDISKWNGNEAEDIKKKDSITFIICKATEGITGVDSELENNWRIIKEKKCLLGTYHFYHIQDDPIIQADHFLKTVEKYGQTDIPMIVDIEQESLPSNKKVDINLLQKNLLIFLNKIEKDHGKTPLLYTDEAFAEQYLNNHAFARYPLWLAEYTNAEKPRIPNTWAESGYKIWQKRDNYFIDTHTTDFDVFYGKITDLCK